MCQKTLMPILVLLTLKGANFLQAAPEQITLDIKIENRFLSVGSVCSFQIIIGHSQDRSEAEKKELLSNLLVNFPGYEADGKPAVDSEGRITVKGKIVQPGFFPFEVSTKVGSQTYTIKDYFVAVPDKWVGAFNHYGYFIFMGRGDYWEETHKLAQWTLEDWKKLVDWMPAHNADTLYLLMTGWVLAYPSEKYPTLVDRLSQNARYNFLRTLIDYAHSKNVRVYLTISTDDMAIGFGTLHPETRRMNKYGDRVPNSAIGELGGLVLENKRVKQYVKDLFDELLSLYPNTDGIVTIGYQIDPDRYNLETRQLFYKETGKELTRASKTERYRWYNEKYAEFIVELYSLVTTKYPEKDFIMFGFPWQEDYVQMYKEKFPARIKICVAYYGWEEESFHKWSIWPWVEAFGGDRVVYMPTGVAWAYPLDALGQVERHIGTDRLVSAAEALGVKTCVFYAAVNEGSDEDRTRDLVIARFPETRLVNDRRKRLEIVEKLYKDYFAARDALFK